jgi:hypothetical protein
MKTLLIKTPVGNEFYIQEQDLKHYKGAEILEEIEDETSEVSTDE